MSETITPRLIDTVRCEYAKAIDAINEKLGLNGISKIGTIRYDANTFRFQFHFNALPTTLSSTISNQPSVVESSAELADRTSWLLHCRQFKLKESDHNRTYDDGKQPGTRYRLIAIKPENRLYPIISINLKTGARVKGTVDFVVRRLALEAPSVESSTLPTVKPPVDSKILIPSGVSCNKCAQPIDKREYFRGCVVHAKCEVSTNLPLVPTSSTPAPPQKVKRPCAYCRTSLSEKEWADGIDVCQSCAPLSAL
jgi:hypothetical protein